MKVIATATNLATAFKNVGRVTEIIGVFAKHGFGELFHRMSLSRFISKPTDERLKHVPVNERLRMSFEELGPTFVKLGQLLAGRSDLLPESYIRSFEKLQDNVATVPFPEIKNAIEKELGAPLDQIFSLFEQTPLAAASIAQVHGAILNSGENVAIKVQRPDIARLIHSDISILRGLAFLLERYVPEIRTFNPQGLVDEFFRSILYELDFRVEANNVKRIGDNLSSFKKVAIPKVYFEKSGRRILVLERFEGIRFPDRNAIVAAGINPVEILEIGADAFFHMVMKDGLFHGDLHAGNLFVLRDGRIGIIDFGIVGRLSRRVQDSIISMFVAIMDEDFETLASEYLSLSPSSEWADVYQLQKELMDNISPYVGMALGDVNIGDILLRSTHIAAKHKLTVPKELMLLFRAIYSIDGLGKALDPHFDIRTLGIRHARQVLAGRYSKERLLRDLIVIGRETQSTMEMFPRLFKRFLRTWGQNRFAIEIKNPDAIQIAKALLQLSRTLVMTIGMFGLIAIGITFETLSTPPHLLGHPWLSIICFAMASAIGLHTVYHLKRHS